ncbi:MAG: c-type cytochrome [Terriglobia bacterium]|jgi:mono/diheme cytochrome c family protein
MKKFAAGVIVTLVCITVGAYAYFAGGFAPVATASSPMPFEKQLAKIALNAKLQKETPKTVPIEANEANYLAGAHECLINCAVCHGVPGKEKTAIARGEFPIPPELFHGKGVTNDPPGQTFWKVANGIRLTGMPSFNRSLSQTQIWQISLMLANADKLPNSVAAVLAGHPEVPQPTPAAVADHPTPTK